MSQPPPQPLNPDGPPPHDSSPQPLSAEEQARISKLKAETALLCEQVQQVQRENKAANRWFVPTIRLIFQALSAGFVLVGAFFFL
jgi:hypothetical protein